MTRVDTAKSTDNKKLWGGRFSQATDEFVEGFTASVGVDRRLYRQDIAGSIAHARMLEKTGLLSQEELQLICGGLQSLAESMEQGKFQWSVALEDVHGNIEAALIRRIGETGKKLHSGRSRNDQAATDLRLYVREAADDIMGRITNLQQVLLDLAEREADSIMPGFTHMQSAQPVTFGHHLMAWVEMLERDYGRFHDCRRRLNLCPLGAAALAGTSHAIDREYTAALLDFDGPTRNSLDSVSDRDFAIEFTACCSLLMVHLSRFAEELVLWASPQFAFVELPDAFCTGSSIMPQKKNPDLPELVRGKSGRVCGHLTALLMLMKSQPLAYNKDNQEDKVPVFDCSDTVQDCLTGLTAMLAEMKCNRPQMRQAAEQGHATATDLADYLVHKGLAFRDAHAAVGAMVKNADAANCKLSDLPLATLQKHCSLIAEDVYAVLDVDGSVESRAHIGGTAPTAVRSAIKATRARLAAQA